MWNREILQKEKKKYLWTLVLDFFELVELVGIIDWEDDYYYVYRQQNWENNEVSCVVWFTPLKWKLDKKDYDKLRKRWEMNVLDKYRLIPLLT